MRASRNTTQKTAQNFPKCILRPKFLECICLKKTPFVLSSRHTYTSKKTKEMVKITKSTRALCSFLLRVALFLSLFLSFVLCFLCVRVFFLFLLSCVCVCVCVRVGVSSGLIFVSRSSVFFSRTHVLTFPLFIISHLLIQFAASAPATSADRPWP